MNPSTSNKKSPSPATPPRSWLRWVAAAALCFLAGTLAFVWLHGRGRDAPASRPTAVVQRGSYRNRALLPQPTARPETAPDEKPAILGTVYDTEGNTLPDARVTVLIYEAAGNIPTSSGNGRSDEDGRFEIAVVAGTYQLNVSKEGYGPTSVVAQSGDTISVVLPKTGAITGRVLDEGGEPARRFTIDLVTAVPADAPAPPPIWSRAFDSHDGTFEARELPAWPVIVRATAADRAPAFSAPIQVKAGDTREVELKLTAGCELTGTVHTKDGHPLPGVLVNAEERMTQGSVADPAVQASNTAVSDDDGSFRLEHVPTGTVIVRGYDADNAVSTLTLNIKDCASLAPVKLTMSPGGSVEGVAREADGSVLAGARLSLTERSIGIVNTVSDKDGRFRFDDLPAGVLRLELDRDSRSALRFVQIKEGQTTRQDIALFAAGDGEIRGRVMAGKVPLPGAKLFVASNRGRTMGIAMYFPVTGPDGTFRVPSIPEGGYLISVLSTSEGRAAQVKAGEVTDVDLDVSFVAPIRDPSTPLRPSRRAQTQPPTPSP